MIVILDTAILISLTTAPQASDEVYQCHEWLFKLLSKGVYVVSPEICDYEVRRGILLLEKKLGLTDRSQMRMQALESLRELIEFLPISREVLLEAANFWAETRKEHQPTANDDSLDADMITSAHWKLLKADFPGQYIVIATDNTRHLRLFCEAQQWRDIKFL